LKIRSSCIFWEWRRQIFQ